jgi:antitoxin component YwqK of YwqJK toxin-antitoxin module
MKMSARLFTFFCVFFCFYATAQMNQTDSKGRKQGAWEKNYPNKALRFKGQFKDDIPFGTFQYYHPNGQKRAVNVYRKNSGVCISQQFDEEGKLIAEGKYIGEKKDSVWSFYNPKGVLISTETYQMDVKNGLSKTYFDNGKVAEEVAYVDGKREGVWIQRIDDGTVVAKAQFVADILNGEAKYFDTSGTPVTSGKYTNGLQHNTWIEYNSEGRPSVYVKYKWGKEVSRKDIK